MQVSPATAPRLSTGTEPGNLHDSTDSSRTSKPVMLPAGFSFVVDDVDGDLPEQEADCGRRSSPAAGAPGGAARRQDEAARVQQIKVEAESRKHEFAKLLEEHAQVVKELKKMEDEPLQA
ncbi:uncharacterized protein LOC134536281 [Bacillus rossius redtenbacheri]|uniref:uncharacterized protein LOC134536281 n=1 Tax=Bacillus rossius redtenbacheri TaxID=93214 RepID=UPI002FDE1253